MTRCPAVISDYRPGHQCLPENFHCTPFFPLVERIRRSDNPDMDEVVDAILADSGGDAHRAIESLVELNLYLMREKSGSSPQSLPATCGGAVDIGRSHREPNESQTRAKGRIRY